MYARTDSVEMVFLAERRNRMLEKMNLSPEEKEIARQMTAPVDASAMRIETERLILRPVEQKDLMDLHAVTGDPAVAEQAGFSLCKTLEESQKRVEEFILDNETLALELKESGTVIGTVSIQMRPWAKYPLDRKLRGRELGFDLARSYWGRGLMPEAVRAVCAYCFETLHYDFVTCGHFTSNAQSGRAIEKCGFAFQFDTTADYPDGRKIPVRSYVRYNPELRGDKDDRTV